MSNYRISLVLDGSTRIRSETILESNSKQFLLDLFDGYKVKLKGSFADYTDWLLHNGYLLGTDEIINDLVSQYEALFGGN
jgi:hypothetical protein